MNGNAINKIAEKENRYCSKTNCFGVMSNFEKHLLAKMSLNANAIADANVNPIQSSIERID